MRCKKKAYSFFILAFISAALYGGVPTSRAQDLSLLTPCEVQSQNSLLPDVFDPRLKELSLTDAVLQLGTDDEAGETLRMEMRALLEDSHFFRSGLFLHLIRNYFISVTASSERISADQKTELFLKNYTSLEPIDQLNFTRSILDLLVNTWSVYPTSPLKATTMAHFYGLTVSQYLQLCNFFRSYRQDDPALWKLQAAMLLSLQHNSATLLKQLKDFTCWYAGSCRQYKRTLAKLPILVSEKNTSETITDLSLTLRYVGIPPWHKTASYTAALAAEEIPPETLDYLLHRSRDLFSDADLDFLHSKQLNRLSPSTKQILASWHVQRQPQLELQRLTQELQNSEAEETSLLSAISQLENPPTPPKLKEILSLRPNEFYPVYKNYAFEILYDYLVQEGAQLSLEDTQKAMHQLVRFIRTFKDSTVYTHLTLAAGLSRSLYLTNSFLDSLMPVVDALWSQHLINLNQPLPSLEIIRMTAPENLRTTAYWTLPNADSLRQIRLEEQRITTQKQLKNLREELTQQMEISRNLNEALAEAKIKLQQNVDHIRQPSPLHP